MDTEKENNYKELSTHEESTGSIESAKSAENEQPANYSINTLQRIIHTEDENTEQDGKTIRQRLVNKTK